MAAFELDDVERVAIAALLREKLAELDVQRFMSSLRVKSRDIGGSGFISELHCIGNLLPVFEPDLNPLTGFSRHPSLSAGAIFSLWFNRDGSFDYLEGATLGGEKWPLDQRGFEFD